MITTVSVTTITTVTAIAALGLGAALSMAAAGVLVFLLATRELALARGSDFSFRLGTFAAVAIVPLLLAFAAVLVLRIVAVLG